eukprot:GEMP01079654.1.p1 GENE.GEMP01079654.1~~GEMP01079654.1.p1  ORF type:complete len:173 (+),score=20.87 GEMP01079654.1:59-577(+)
MVFIEVPKKWPDKKVLLMPCDYAGPERTSIRTRKGRWLGLATVKSHQIAKVVASGQLQSLTGHAKHIPKSVCDTREEFTSLTRGFTEVWAWKIQPIAIDGPFDCTFPEFLVQNVEFHPAKKLKLEDFVASCSETQRENGDEWLNNRHGKVCKALEVRAQIVAFRQLLTAPPK